MSQLSFFADPVGAKRERDKGTEIVTDHNEDWHIRAMKLLGKLAGTQYDMTGEDMKRWLVVRGGLDEPTHDNAWGALVLHAARINLIERTGRTSLGTTKQSHARRLQIWRFK